MSIDKKYLIDTPENIAFLEKIRPLIALVEISTATSRKEASLIITFFFIIICFLLSRKIKFGFSPPGKELYRASGPIRGECRGIFYSLPVVAVRRGDNMVSKASP